jgi:hypothetical protein
LKGTVKHREALDKQIASALFSPLTEEKMPDDKILPFKALTESMADRFEVAPKELLDTVRAVCFKGAASDAQLMMLLSFAKNYDLNPLAKECYAFVKEGRMSIGVQVDGWSKIANRQDNYDGQEIEYENDKDGKVVSITSRTYVKGRAKPTVYRAMMSEWNRKTARHVKDARLKLLLSQVGAVSVEAATDEQIAMLIQRIEARRGK